MIVTSVDGRALKKRGLSPKRARWTVISCALVGLMVACGGSDEPNEPAAQDSPESVPAEADLDDDSGYGFSDWKFQKVAPKACEQTEKLGAKKSIKLETPDVVGAVVFRPMCLTDVKSDEVTVTVVNTSGGNTHNFIVEGNEVEIIVPAGEKDTVEVTLPDQPQVGFQCTIHPPMYGAFFRA
jgi:hypothetical protein